MGGGGNESYFYSKNITLKKINAENVLKNLGVKLVKKLTIIWYILKKFLQNVRNC